MSDIKFNVLSGKNLNIINNKRLTYLPFIKFFMIRNNFPLFKSVDNLKQFNYNMNHLNFDIETVNKPLNVTLQFYKLYVNKPLLTRLFPQYNTSYYKVHFINK